MWRLVTKRKRNRVDPIELVVLAVFAATSVWVLVLGLWWTVTEGRVWTGVNGVYVQDVTQYLAWVRDASRHVLVSDLFVLRASPHDYLHQRSRSPGASSRSGWHRGSHWRCGSPSPSAARSSRSARSCTASWTSGSVDGRRWCSPCSARRSARSRTCGFRGGHGDTYSGCCRWQRWSLRCSFTSVRFGAPRRCGRRRCWPGSRAGCTRGRGRSWR